MLERPELPSTSEWSDALEEAGHTFGIALPGKALHADNLKRFHTDLRGKLDQLGDAAVGLPAALARWCQVLGVPADSPRRITATSAETLVATLQGQPAVAQVRALAAFEAKTSRAAVGRSLASGPTTLAALDVPLNLGVFQQLIAKEGEPAVEHILEQARAVLRKDEVNETLSTRIRQLAEEGQKLLMHAVAAPDPVPKRVEGRVVFSRELSATGRDDAIAELSAMLEDARAAVSGATGEVTLQATIRIASRPAEGEK